MLGALLMGPLFAFGVYDLSQTLRFGGTDTRGLDSALAFAISPLVLFAFCLWRAWAYERSDDAREGVPQRPSKFLLVLAYFFPVAAVVMRLRGDRGADDVQEVLALFAGFLLIAPLSFLARGRRVDTTAETEAR